MPTAFKHLLEPVCVGDLTLKNRMVRSPILTGMTGPDGEVTDQLVNYYATAARGGPALIILEIAAVAGRYAFASPQLHIDDIKLLPGLHRLVEAIHINGAACEFQLHCAGTFGRDPISPSGVPTYGLGRATYVKPRALSLSEVEEIRDYFIAAAVRAQETECDGVVLHGATSYLLQQWVSPHTNKRDDRYGGSFEKRIALPLEIIRGIRAKCGPSFVLGYSMVIDELLPDGVDTEEALAFARILRDEGINHIDLMVGTYETSSGDKSIGRNSRQPAGLFDRTAPFKEIGDVKIFARCTGEHNPAVWEEALAQEQCDVIQIGRPLLCDPEIPEKLRQGRPEDIRLCIKCVQCYETAVIKHFQVACSLNPSIGKENEYVIRPAAVPKRVVVVGGGPGGLEAARVTALRGHKVTLFEKQNQLGGNARIGALPVGKEVIQTNYIDWAERACRQAGAGILLGREATLEDIKRLKPDAVILAAGSRPCYPAIPGIDKPHVVTAEDVLALKAPVGKKVVVAGGGLVGVETADFIVEKKLAEDVTVVEMLPALATDMPVMLRTYMLEVILPRNKINAVTNTQITEIRDDAVLACAKDGKEVRFAADTVVNAMGYIADNSLARLRREFPEFYMIGDCVKARNIMSAIHEAAFVARQI